MWRSPKIAKWLAHCLNQSRINWGRKKPNASRNNKYQPRWLYFCFCYKNPLLWQAIFKKSRQNHVCTKKRIDDIFLLVKLTFFFNFSGQQIFEHPKWPMYQLETLCGQTTWQNLYFHEACDPMCHRMSSWNPTTSEQANSIYLLQRR